MLVQSNTKPRQPRRDITRLMLLGNGEYLAQMAKKYGEHATLKEVIEMENKKGGKHSGK